MAEVDQYSFSLVELTEALIKQQGLHEGQWITGVELNITVGIMGPSSETSRPGAMLVANQVHLTRATPGQHPAHLVVDAAAVNPKAAKAAKPKSRAK